MVMEGCGSAGIKLQAYMAKRQNCTQKHRLHYIVSDELNGNEMKTLKMEMCSRLTLLRTHSRYTHTIAHARLTHNSNNAQ